MEELEKKLKELKELLEKGMMNGGLGGPGSVISGKVLPSRSIGAPKTPKPSNGTVKIPGTTPTTKTSPVKSAEQTQNKDIKDLKMKEAQAALKVAPMVKEELSFCKNGQWKIDEVEKSGYQGYTDTDNARRKANNIGDTGIKSMPRVKQYGGSGANAAGREAAQMKAKSKKNPVKEFSPEEIAAINAKQD